MWPFRRRAQEAMPQASDHLSALAAALSAMQERLELRPTSHAGICLRSKVATRKNDGVPLSLTEVASIADDALLWGTETSGTALKTTQDRFGYLWVALKNTDFGGLVVASGKIAAKLREKGRGDHLVVAIFQFRQQERQVFWMYNFAQGRFYPFVPLEEPRRDSALELSMAEALEKTLPIEPRLERWHGLWGVPLDA